MKVLSSTVWCLIALLVSVGVPTQALATLEDGLVAYYPFNGNANDESGNGNHGTVIEAILTADRFGWVDRAYSFDGVGDYIVVTDDPALRLVDTSFTLSAWIYQERRGVTASAILEKRGDESRAGYHWVIDELPGGIGHLGFSISGGLDPGFNSSSVIPLGSWHHVVTTYHEGIRTAEMYIDGVLDTTEDSFPSPNPISIDLFIGRDSSHDGYYFPGAIDDVRIYNRPLSEAEIAELYQLGSFVHGTAQANHTWTSINTPTTFTNPVVIVGPPTYHGADPGVVRLRNVSDTGFEIRFDEWDYRDRDFDDTTHAVEDISYLIAWPGHHDMSDGSVWEAGTFALDGTANWTTQSFTESFAEAPHLFLTAQTR